MFSLALTFSVFAQTPPAAVRFDITGYAVEGSPLLRTEDFSRIVSPFIGKQKTGADVQKAQQALQQAYLDLGHCSVQVTAQKTEPDAGVIIFRLVQSAVPLSKDCLPMVVLDEKRATPPVPVAPGEVAVRPLADITPAAAPETPPPTESKPEIARAPVKPLQDRPLEAAPAAPTPGNNAHALATALFKAPSLNMTINNNALATNGLTQTGGTAIAAGTGSGSCLGGGGSCATAAALLSSDTTKDITVTNGNLSFKGGTAEADGTTATATALAGTDAGNVTTLAVALTVTTENGKMTLTGGTETTIMGSGGSAKADATMLSTGAIKLNAFGGGLTLNGGSGSGLFQNLSSSGTVISLDGSIPPVTVVGGFPPPVLVANPLNTVVCSPPGPCPPNPFVTFVNVTADAFVESGAPPSNLDPLLVGLLSAIDQSKSNRIGGILEDKNQAASKPGEKNYCK